LFFTPFLDFTVFAAVPFVFVELLLEGFALLLKVFAAPFFCFFFGL